MIKKGFCAGFWLCVLSFSHLSLAQEQRVFPLPTREERIRADVHAPGITVARLVQMLHDPDSTVKAEAAKALAERGDVVALEDLKEVALTVDGAQAEIRKAIAKLEAPLPPKNDEKPDPKWVEASITRLKAMDPREPNYSDLLLGLTKTGDVRSIPLLESYLVLRPQYPDDPLNERPVRENIVELEKLYWDLKWRGKSVAQKIQALRDAAASRENLLAGNPDNGLLIDGIWSGLAQAGDAIVPSLGGIISDTQSSGNLYDYALNALYEIRSPAAIAAMRLGVKSPDAEKSNMATQFLLHLHDKAAAQDEVPRVLKILKEGGQPAIINDIFRETQQLAELGVDKAILETAVLPYIREGNPIVLTALREFGSDKSVPSLLELLNQPGQANEGNRFVQDSVALTTLSIVGKNRPELALPTFLSFCAGPNSTLRTAAVQALAQYDNPLAVPELLALAKKEKDNTALYFEVSGLYYIGGQAGNRALLEMKNVAQNSKSAFVKKLVEEGLFRLQREGRNQ